LEIEHANSTARTACGVIDRQLQQLTRLVDDLLDIGRIAAGGVELIQERFDLRELLNTAQASLLPAFAHAGQSCRLHLPEDPLWVKADRTRLLQVFTNLLTNANKYTPDGGVIEVDSGRRGEWIVVSVRDSGIGISAEMLERVFDLFAQVDRSAQRTRGGLGIGLALAKRLLEAHGGRIEARSDGPGKGTELILELPAG
jgi:signal transduction histidine kinase